MLRSSLEVVFEMKLPEEVKRLFEAQSIVAFGTADKEGKPNVVPIVWKTILNDETVLLLDNYMKMSKQNVMENANVCISFWDPKTNEAYKIKGIGTYHADGTIYDAGKKFMQSKKPKSAPRGVVEVKVTEAYTIRPGSKAGEKL
ncbi:pyridoxamine 5'-phosphate oxidase [ANME-1 cluster archaeon GoMg4]|nr:pyridoxamine 5'-phosphate oxidase [ANME-1 cluster archaeon GoMg4]